MARTRVLIYAWLVCLIAGAPAAVPLHAQVGKPVAIVDANTATEKELLALPHMNATLVKGILDKRPFKSPAELNAFLSPSLTPEQLKELYGKLFVHLNLNGFTNDEVLMIPGAGPRMVREFNEYKPYKALAQWHREIDKYVDDAELARLEQYVFVPIDLNAATDADLQTIPGVNPKTLGAIKQGRPWKTIEQFKTAIAKAASPKEAARLERYMTIAP